MRITQWESWRSVGFTQWNWQTVTFTHQRHKGCIGTGWDALLPIKWKPLPSKESPWQDQQQIYRFCCRGTHVTCVFSSVVSASGKSTKRRIESVCGVSVGLTFTHYPHKGFKKHKSSGRPAEIRFTSVNSLSTQQVQASLYLRCLKDLAALAPNCLSVNGVWGSTFTLCLHPLLSYNLPWGVSSPLLKVHP